MRTIKTRLFLMGCIAAAMVTSIGCSKDNPLNPLGGCSDDANWVNRISVESTDYSNALSTYSNDPTDANCSQLKTAGKNYLDALAEVAKCVPTVNQADYKKAVDEAKADIDENGCD